MYSGVDFDDAEYGYKEEGKDSSKVGSLTFFVTSWLTWGQAENELALKKLCDDSDGLYGTLAQAIEELSMPRMKVTKPVNSYKGLLTLGNPIDYDTAMTIDVERYPRVMVQRPPSASQFVIKSDMAPTQSNSTEDRAAQDLAAVKNSRTYQVIDEEAPGGKRDVEQDELAKGYNYGSTAVPIAESDRNVTTFETMPCLDIIGFIQQNQVSNGLSSIDCRKTN